MVSCDSSSMVKPSFTISSALLISVLLLIIYSNSFNAGWHMDDRPNIINNKALHLQDLMPKSLWQTFFSNQGRATPALFRPLACFTFALNWYIGQDDSFGYHAVNFGFHVGTAIALYLLVVSLLSLLYKQDEHESICNISLLAVVLWAIHPIQTQAVTYIVQRMALMAAFFYVLSMLSYVKARTSSSTRQQISGAFFCILWFLFAMGSKENAVMLPLSLLLIEWIFFQKARTDFFQWPATWVIAVGLGIILIIFIVFYFGGAPIETMKGWYGKRPFSLEERLMTQPRVLLGYLFQIFYPLPERFSIVHDVKISQSLLYPWTTLPALGIVIVMITGAFFLSKPYPLLSVAVLFFFLNHSIEASIFPLEIVFEHRNYLPTLFLFLPIAAGLYPLLQKLRCNNKLLYVFMVVTITSVITSIGLSTYTRNQAWATGITLWTDAAKKAPNHLRPIVTLGIRLAWQPNPSPDDYKMALALFKHALELPEAARRTEKAEILGNIGSIYFHRGENDKAIETYRKAVEMDRFFLKNRFDLIKPLVLTGQFSEAARHTEFLLAKNPNHPDYHNIMGFILLWGNRPDEALIHFQKALKHRPHKPNLLLNTGVALTRLGRWDNGRWFLQQASNASPNDFIPHCALIENRSKAGDCNTANKFARRIIARFPVVDLCRWLDNADSSYRVAPISSQHVLPFIDSELANIECKTF